MLLRLHRIILLLWCASNSVIFGAQPLVNISSGSISGDDITLLNGKVVHVFLGIPYALPPVGENRFEEPKPFGKWQGVWNGTTYTKSCVQFSLMNNLVLGEEDCLYVNVFTPKLPEKSDQPRNDVIVWFHGGSFMHGTANHLTPEYLLQSHDIVFVSVNYRLAMFGFYSTDDDVVPGNNGLKDQLLALQWVQKNIEKFGGNPNSITIAGNSAGASAVHFLILTPLSKGLFQKAIMASGTALQPWLLLDKTVPTISKRLASIAGCPTDSSSQMVNCLKTRPAAKIADSYTNFQVWRHLGYLFGPIVEPPGKNRFLQNNPITLMRNRTDKIPCLMSVVQNEGYIGLNDFVGNGDVLKQMDKNFEHIAPFMLFYYHKLPENQRSQFADKIRRIFFNNQSLVSGENYPKLIQFLGDRLITAYVEFSIREHTKANFGPIYYSIFNYTGERSIIYLNNAKNFAKATKVSHADDMLYLMRSSHFGEGLKSPEDKKVAELMANIWASFVKTGKPETNINWPAVSKGHPNGLEYLRINSPSDLRIASTNNIDSFEFWNGNLNEFPEVNRKIKDEL